MLDRTLRVCYRALLREIRQIERSGMEFSLQAPVDKGVWLERGGHHSWAKTGIEYRLQTAKVLVPWMAERLAALEVLDGPSLRALLRREFREPAPPKASTPAGIDRAIHGLRLLGQQVHLARGSSCATTRDVRVEVTAEFVGRAHDLQLSLSFGDDDDEEEEEEEDGGDGSASSKLFYTYRVRVSNVGKDTVQLTGRHWIIEDGQGILTEVPKGTRGVVGCTPIIKPGTCFQYYSGTDLERAPGLMHGSFQMAVLSDDQQRTLERFDAKIAPFQFWPPPALPERRNCNDIVF